MKMKRDTKPRGKTTGITRDPSAAGVRLHKFLAGAGIASRREAERHIQAGRVEVNGRVVNVLGARIDPERDSVRIDGRRVLRNRPLVYYLLHKPRGYITSASDPLGRPTVLDLVPRARERIFPVGRLDWNSEGLLILTNDGDLAQRLTHPSNHVPKIYRVKVKGIIPTAALERVRRGIHLDGRRTRPARVTRLSSQTNSWVEITLHEGRRNQIRRVFQRLGHPVLKLHRVAIGPISDHGLQPGRVRELTPLEVRKLGGKG
jgi:pseudouridine synthase